MNVFMYNLGKRTANAVDGTIAATGAAGTAVVDAAVSYKQGFMEQSAQNHVPRTTHKVHDFAALNAERKSMDALQAATRG